MNATPSTNKYGARAYRYFIFGATNMLLAGLTVWVFPHLDPNSSHSTLDAVLSGMIFGLIITGFVAYIAAAICGVEHLIKD